MASLNRRGNRLRCDLHQGSISLRRNLGQEAQQRKSVAGNVRDNYETGNFQDLPDGWSSSPYYGQTEIPRRRTKENERRASLAGREQVGHLKRNPSLITTSCAWVASIFPGRVRPGAMLSRCRSRESCHTRPSAGPCRLAATSTAAASPVDLAAREIAHRTGASRRLAAPLAGLAAGRPAESGSRTPEDELARTVRDLVRL